jgi:hypothetical protein
MVAAKTHTTASANTIKNIPVATFKSSLRRWQAQWKAQQNEETTSTSANRLTAEFLLGDNSAASR